MEEYFNDMVSREIFRARAKHSGKMHSYHEAYAVIKEEFDEFWQEVMKQSKDQSKQRMLEELIQVAAMCRRAAEDLLDVPQND